LKIGKSKSNWVSHITRAGADPGGGAIGAIAPRKTYKSNFVHHDFVNPESKIRDIYVPDDGLRLS